MRIFVLLVCFLLLPACGDGGAGDASSEKGISAESRDVLSPPESDGSPATDPVEDRDVDGGPQDQGGPAGPSTSLGEEAALGEEVEPGDPDEGSATSTDSRFPRPKHVRGIYLNAWTAGSWARRGRLIEMARRTEVNSFVIDIKDASGHVSHPTGLSLAREVGATEEVRIRDLPALLNQLEEAGIYPIARIVVAKDPILAEGRPDLAIQDTAGGPWLDQKEVKWLNFHHQEVWDYHLDLAVEVAKAGFPEIQWDYVRFPDAPESYLSRAVYPGSEGRTKTRAVREFLGYTREVLRGMGVLVTADVFGVTTSYRRDVGIGQVWESFIDQVDVALPMVYPSHYWTGSFGYEAPNGYPYEIVRRALRDAVRRSALVDGAGLTRPWLQDFTLGEPAYGSPEIRAQIQAAYDVGIQEWILWNPGSRYTEAALYPARGLPSWLEPVMRVGGEVVKVSRRFEVLGEEDPGNPGSQGGSPTLEDPALPTPQMIPGTKALPASAIPDSVKARLSKAVPDTTGSGFFGPTG